MFDGTLASCGRTGDGQADYSHKHHRHGVNLQVVTDPTGHVLWISPALPGRAHDSQQPARTGSSGSANARYPCPCRPPLPGSRTVGDHRAQTASGRRTVPDPAHGQPSTGPGPDTRRTRDGRARVCCENGSCSFMIMSRGTWRSDERPVGPA
ncbi:transposase family protein [Streptomyces virginiae]|uniref:transposase family protein n=1 Tax=Streptomyces virginiae TaxID=1961 RepID=UPI0036C21018